MRLSEKTIELTFCSQFSVQLGLRNIIWFGLTQAQERRFGFDACIQLNGRLLILQFKASNIIVHPRRFRRPRRRFVLPHNQLERLQNLAGAFPRMVYYALPNIGTTLELLRNRDIISQTFGLQVSRLPNPFPIPTNRTQIHYAYIDPPAYEIKSKPFEGKLIEAIKLQSSLKGEPPNSKEFVNWCLENNFSFEGLRAYGILWKSDEKEKSSKFDIHIPSDSEPLINFMPGIGLVLSCINQRYD